LHFPSYSEDSARYLVANRHVAGLGVDTASIDYGQSKDFIVHQIAMGANVPGFENLANLDRVPERGAWVIALPMKIAGGSGAPLRAIAVIPAFVPNRRLARRQPTGRGASSQLAPAGCRRSCRQVGGGPKINCRAARSR
jgi:hypothetical protein